MSVRFVFWDTIAAMLAGGILVASAETVKGYSTLPQKSPSVPIVLEPLASNEVDLSVNVVGRCGQAIVEVNGIDPSSLDSYRFWASSFGNDLFVTINDKRIQYPGVFSDRNVVYCVGNKNGKWLLFGRTCGGNVCPESFNFLIINTRTGRTYPKPAGDCDARCVNRYLGLDYFDKEF